ncbi:hypothetical protein R1sor_003795 [Riccia sorocarpa]|uniref:Enoyl reductase (ER) domain-containing protein n=1 Tax=Riccia sorocarpa TaxID=122646 RepID=A0ABD3H2N3_9MARC
MSPPFIDTNLTGVKKVLGYAAKDSSGRLEPFVFSRRPTGPDDVVIRVLYCGVCHSDLHQIRDEWSSECPTKYPIVPGHEITGVVAAVGDNVTRFKIGGKVGVGCLVNSCGKCGHCKQNLEQYCEKKAVWTYNDTDVYADDQPTYGGYSTLMVTPERFCIKIPDGLPMDAAAPLLCAGITVYSPMKHYKMEQGGRHFGVVGLGGLGYMAAKFARAMGMQVTVISTNPDKENEARACLRADDFVLSTDPKQMKRAEKTLDFIINTVSAPHSFDTYLPLLKTNGKLVGVGIPQRPLHVSSLLLAAGRRSVAGSLIGGLKETQEMMDFCGQHHIFCLVERIPIDYINRAMERLATSDVKYRFVIDMKTIKHPTEIYGCH